MIFEYGHKTTNGFVRNQYLTHKEVFDRIGLTSDQYISIFGYESEDIEHCNIYGPFYLDLDYEPNPSLALSDLQTILSVLKFYGLTREDYRICFSGHKGYHITIHPKTLGIIPDVDLDKVYKRIAEWFNRELSHKTIDFKIYERRRLWRLINSKHGKTGLFKIEIDGNESLEEIKEKAKNPIWPMREQTPKLNAALSEWVYRARKERAEEQTSRSQKKILYYSNNKTINQHVQDTINNGALLGNRNHVLHWLCCYFKAKNFSQEEAMPYLQTYQTNCSPSYDATPEDRSGFYNTIKRVFSRGGVGI